MVDVQLVNTLKNPFGTVNTTLPPTGTPETVVKVVVRVLPGAVSCASKSVAVPAVMAGPVAIVPEVNAVRVPVAPAASMVRPPEVCVVTVYVKGVGVAEGEPVLQPLAVVEGAKTIVVAPAARMAPPVVQVIFPDEEAGVLH